MKAFSLSVPGGSFTLRLWPTCLSLLMILILLGLGTWQVKRLVWKEQLVATIAERSKAQPQDVTSIRDMSDVDYRHAEASGVFENDKELYLSSISLNGEGGYHVLTPLDLPNGNTLLVDRGFIPYDKRDPKTRSDGETIGPVTVLGLLRRPIHKWFEPQNDPSKNNWYGIDIDAMAKQAGLTNVLPFVLEADAKENPGGYPVGGQTHISLPNNHLGYALTWYGLALALFVMYLGAHYKPRSKS